MPSWRTTRTVTRLRECTSASRSRVGPEKLFSLFSGRQIFSWPLSSYTIGASMTMVEGVKPFSSAAEYRNGLNPEPGWRRACVTRLNLLSK